MKAMTEEVKEYLEAEPRARERANKDRAIVNILLRRNPVLASYVSRGMVEKDELVSFAQDYSSTDRAWRKTLQDFPHLRGKDYEDKEELERDAQATLGYNVPPMAP